MSSPDHVTAEDMAIAVRHRHRIRHETARELVDEWIRQVDYLDTGNRFDPAHIPTAIAVDILDKIDAAHRAGELGARALEELRTNTEVRRHAEEARDGLIVRALETGARVTDVAAAAGVSRETIRRIRTQHRKKDQ